MRVGSREESPEDRKSESPEVRKTERQEDRKNLLQAIDRLTELVEVCLKRSRKKSR